LTSGTIKLVIKILRGQHRQRDRQRKGDDAVDKHQRQIHRDHLPAPGADEFHDADLVDLLRDQRRDRVDDQEGGEQQNNPAEEGKDHHRRVDNGLDDRLADDRATGDGAPAPLDALLDGVNDGLRALRRHDSRCRGAAATR
jgi:hypothetical protein